MSINSFIKFNNLDYKDSINIFKRINRITPNFYNLEEETVILGLLDKPLDMLVLLQSKYSLVTTLHTIQFCILLYKYYDDKSEALLEYEDIENDLLSIYENPKSYSKMTITELEEFLELKVVEFTKKETSYTKIRNLLLLALLSQYQLKLSEIVDIKYISYEGSTFEEVFPNHIGIVKRNCDYYIVRNGKTIIEQKVEKIEFVPLHRALALYISKFKRGEVLLCGIDGKILTKSNLSNGLVNFTRSELGFALSINDVRNLQSTSLNY